jgi:hypothetical protein
VTTGSWALPSNAKSRKTPKIAVPANCRNIILPCQSREGLENGNSGEKRQGRRYKEGVAVVGLMLGNFMIRVKEQFLVAQPRQSISQAYLNNPNLKASEMTPRKPQLNSTTTTICTLY